MQLLKQNHFLLTSVYECMKYFVTCYLLMLLSLNGAAQQTVLNDFNAKREHINKTAFIVLGAFSAANIIYGTIASTQTSGTTKYFHQMNAIWNGVTLGILAIGRFTAKPHGDLSFGESLKKQQGIEKIYLFNAGLDLAYIGTGAYLYEKSKTTIKKPERLKGYGQSLLLQGGALLLYDVIMYSIHNKHGRQLSTVAARAQFAVTGNGIGLLVNL